jgi:hypothetical protein
MEDRVVPAGLAAARVDPAETSDPALGTGVEQLKIEDLWMSLHAAFFYDLFLIVDPAGFQPVG